MNQFISTFKRFREFHGRSSRPEYWYFFLYSSLVGLFFCIIDLLLGTWSKQHELGFLSGLWVLIVILPSLAVGCRRLHDINRSGWWQLINIVPWIGPPILLVMFALKGTDGKNSFG